MTSIISIIISVVLLYIVNRVGGKDEKQLPKKPLLHLFLRGAAVTAVIIIISLVTDGWEETVLSGVFGISSDSIPYYFFDNFFFVALVEEGMKYIVIRSYLKKHNIVKYAHNSVSAAVAVGAGFAAVENILYILLGDSSLLLRTLFGLPGHTVYAVLMGYDIAKAIETADPKEKKKYYRRALVIPVLLHGFFDFSCDMLQVDIDALLFLLMLAAMLIIYIRFYIISAIKKIRETAKSDIPIVIPEAAVNFQEPVYPGAEQAVTNTYTQYQYPQQTFVSNDLHTPFDNNNSSQ